MPDTRSLMPFVLLLAATLGCSNGNPKTPRRSRRGAIPRWLAADEGHDRVRIARSRDTTHGKKRDRGRWHVRARHFRNGRWRSRGSSSRRRGFQSRNRHWSRAARRTGTVQAASALRRFPNFRFAIRGAARQERLHGSCRVCAARPSITALVGRNNLPITTMRQPPERVR